MKKLLLSSYLLFIAFIGYGQALSNGDKFEWTNDDGITFVFTVTDATNQEVEINHKSGNFTSIYRMPDTATHNGITYKITSCSTGMRDLLGLPNGGNVKKFIFSKGIKELRYDNSPVYGSEVEEIVWPEELETLENAACGVCYYLKEIDLSNTKVTRIGDHAFEIYYTGACSSFKMPPTLKEIGNYLWHRDCLFKSLTFPAALEKMGASTLAGLTNLEEVTFESSVPPVLTGYIPAGAGCPFPYLNDLHTVYVPVDFSKAYKTTLYWEEHANRYREKIALSPNGYASLYLENENFEVPAGCTAYIVKGLKKSTTPNQAYPEAVAVAFAAGSIIPKQTAFILENLDKKGETISYRAHITTGTEVDATGNLLVGTANAAGEEFNNPGYTYYAFGNRNGKQGFYKQGTRNGESIKVKAHRAGLRIPDGTPISAAAKSFFIDFEAAKQQLTTSISAAQTQATTKKADVIFDLQGRRVSNPTRGIYIINGKKIIK